MSILKWDPFRNMATLQGRINRLFEDAFPAVAENSEDLTESAWHPLVDIFETDSSIIVQVDLPGVDKEDVSVEVKENFLIIKGERRSDSMVGDDSYYRRERAWGAFQRSFAMQSVIAPDKIKATFKNGVLSIDVPKPETEQPKQISVDIE